MYRALPALFLAAALPAAAQVPDLPNMPEGWEIPMIAPLPEGSAPLDPAALDISGAWIYETADHALLQCDFPTSAGQPMSGHMEIAEYDGGVSVTLVTGAECDPASMCLFDGGIAGSVLAVGTSGVVDEEGGVASSGLSILFTAPDAGVGSGTSVYVHPKGYRCSWGYTIRMRRPAEGELD